MEPAPAPLRAIAALGLVSGPDPLVDLDAVTLARLVLDIDSLVGELRTLSGLVQSRLASQMSSRLEDVGPYRLERVRSRVDSWNDDALRRDAMVAIANQVSTTPGTGETDPVRRQAAFDALSKARLLWPMNGSSIRTSPMPSFGLSPVNYRTREDGPFRVRVTQVGVLDDHA